ncbi:MAG: methyltransferase [Geodermatophilaceae bacterium]|nr:methyltransferase [Geodermatophilaceae bacterium]
MYPPGVYRTEDDTDLLIGVMRRGSYAVDRRVLDIGTGSGALAIAAARAGATSVTAVDLSWRSVAATWMNSRLNRAAVSVRHGDLFAPVAGRRFELVVANPPYVPSESSVLPRHPIARAWDAGPDGRALLDRICAGAGDILTPNGDLLLVHSELSGTQRTLDALTEAGLRAQVLARASVPFGPVLRARSAMLESRGMIEPGQRIEKLVVIGARHG